MNDYCIGKLIGTGQFAKVYKCEHKETKTPVALKIIKITSENRNDIINEIQLHNGLKHKNIVYLHGYFRHTEKRKDTFVFVMDYIKGKELFDVISDSIVLDIPTSTKYFRQISEAIQYLHLHNIIHRDIKPENIMITDDGVLKLTDFGLSKRCSKDEFCETYCGTTDYLAPEIVNERSYNYLVDNWALGVLLYEMLYGNAPFYHDKKSRILLNIRKVNYTFPSNSEDFIHVNDVISKLLKKKPKERLQIDKILEHPMFTVLVEEDSSENDESVESVESVEFGDVDDLADDLAEMTTNSARKNLSTED
jgi:serine/threonine protein kinase